MEQDELLTSLNPEKKTIMRNMFRAKKIPPDYHTLDRAGHVTLICLRTGHNRLNSHMQRRINLVPLPLCTCTTEDQTTERTIERTIEMTFGFIQQAGLSV